MVLHERPPFSVDADAGSAPDTVHGAGQVHRLREGGLAAQRGRRAASLLFGWPWLDPLASWSLRRWYFPLSRLWAAAELARGSPEAFLQAVPCAAIPNGRDRLMEALAYFERARVETTAIDKAWEQAFFPAGGAGAVNAAERIALERARAGATHRYNAARRLFRFLLRPGIPGARQDVPDPVEVEAAYGAALADARPVFAPPASLPPIEISRSVATAEGRDFWLRFPSPSARLGDQVHARIYEPAGIANPPTIIFGHGICVEFDQWNGLIDEAVGLCRLRFRVIRPEAPWHGRRRPRGYYGGERMIATFPAGSLDLFTGAVREWAVLAEWARATSSGPLAFGGSSLGALTAQLAASRSADWPESLRPDALLLLTHCERLSEAASDGDLNSMWGSRAVIEARGWDAALVERYLALVDPAPRPPIAPDRIVTVLGKRDRITPFSSGERLVEKWRVPEENRFIWNRGHFSIPLTLMRNDAPFRRLKEILT